MSGRSRGGKGRGRGQGRRRGYGPTGFEDHGGYMAAKISKLSNQFSKAASSVERDEIAGIFKDVAIFVNGYTEPTAEELKRIMMTNGGTYHHYYSRSKTTHIIASNLPDTKIKNLNTSRIVSPKWISDSLEAGYLLNYTNYLLYTDHNTTQPKLPFKRVDSKSTNSPDISKMDLSEISRDSSHMQSEDLTSPYNSMQSSNCHHSEDEDLFADDDVMSNAVPSSLPSADSISTSELKAVVSETIKSSNTSSKDLPKVSNISPVKGHSMSTANPKFLSEFYNNSRLHHISTMGAMFKQYITDMQNKKDGFPGRKGLLEWVDKKRMENSRVNYTASNETSGVTVNSNANDKRTIMHIDMDCFFVSVGLRNHPELRGKPVAVTHSKGNVRTQAREGVDRQYELNFYKARAEKKMKGKIKSSSTAIANGSLPETEMQNNENTDAAPKFSTLPLIDETCSMSEIASCSYEARESGVRNGMFMGPALKLCPNLKTIPYDFEGYKEVAYKLYDIVASFTHDIEAVSCDEMFVDLTELLNTCRVTPLEFAAYLRQEVQSATGCPCSAGMGPNMLIARMATRRAKPNGQYLADAERLSEYMSNEKVNSLPGVGWSLGKRLDSENIKTCEDLQTKSLGQLQTLFGSKTGQSLYYYCRGIDDRPVRSTHMRKSVSAEVNYGIRFTSISDAERFVRELAEEVEKRLSSVKLKGKCITLKLKIRAKDAPVETAKFMGHGVCDNIAKSVSLNLATSSADTIEREVLSMLRQLKIPPQDFRGVGIQVSRLEGHQGCNISTGTSNTSSIKSFLLGAKSKKSLKNSNSSLETSVEKSGNQDSASSFGNDKITTYRKTPSPQPGPSTVNQPVLDTGQPSSPENSVLASKYETISETSSVRETIDTEVLMSLPEDMREQVITEYEQQGYVIPTSCRPSSNSRMSYMNEPQPSTSRDIKTEYGAHQDLNSRLLQREEAPHESRTFASDDSDNDPMVTSFSQVDSSFLAAIPAEMREELRLDFENKKHAATVNSLPGIF
ncbi:deoxycytidyl transferase [Halocaridina rubra]|uniref:DNA repair protein REV1 n=1 Tax=Halocaridina rubra TaxID=373956 RepID=A0AAN8WNF7_HALRR